MIEMNRPGPIMVVNWTRSPRTSGINDIHVWVLEFTDIFNVRTIWWILA